MTPFLRNATLAFLLLAPSAIAQQLTFGQPFSVANTRYGTAQASPVLRTNGRDTFLFWIKNVLRVTRVEKGERHLGIPVFDIPMNEYSYFDAVWTGTHFVVVARGSLGIVGRIVDDNGRPQGEPFSIVDGGFPRVAFNGKYILLIYTNDRWRSLALTPEGRPASFNSQIIGYFFSQVPVVASNGSGFAVILSDNAEQLLMFDENAQLLSNRTLADPIVRWSLTSDGRRFLAVTSQFSSLTATVIEPDGSFGSAVVVDQAIAPSTFLHNPTAVWTSAGRWMIAYTDNSSLRIAELDFSGQQVVSRTTADAREATIMTIGSRGVAAWPSDSGNGVYVSDLPLDVSKGEPVTYAPTEQRVLATTMSADGTTLIVWEEIGDGRYATHAGIRMSDGRWREHELPVSAGAAIASNDGHDFIVILNQTAVRLNTEGEVVPGSMTTISAFRPDSIAWNGQNYAIVGMKQGSVVAALLSPAGTVSNVTTVPFSANVSQSPIIASSGSGFYVAWFTPVIGPLCDPACAPKSIAAIHLDAQLNAVDPLPTLLGGSENEAIYGGALVWNGTHYVLAYGSSKQGIVAARAGTTGGVQSLTTITPEVGYGVAARATTTGVAIGWNTSLRFTSLGQSTEYLVALLRNNGTIDGPRSIHRDSSQPWSQLESLSDGRVAYIFSSVQNSDPYTGSSHVMMQVGAGALPQRPEAPKPVIKKEEHRFRIEWNAPPQLVTGYRVEYKVLDGATWNEFDRWFDLDQRVLVFVPPSESSVYSFRVRAFNDAGPGNYSAAVSTSSLRRRSVR